MITDRGPFIRLFSGNWFYPLNPSPDDVSITDISHSLSLKCRFTGHTKVFYSVAEHSCRVFDGLSIWTNDTGVLLQALLHDSAEAYLTDVAAPYKGHLRIGLESFAQVEDRILHAILDHFKVEHTYCAETALIGLAPAVKAMDKVLYRTELRDLMNGPKKNINEALPEVIIPWTAEAAEYQFMCRFWRLMEEWDGRAKANMD